MPISNSGHNRGRTASFGCDVLFMLAILTLASTALSAQPSAAIVGDYAGTLSSLHVKLQVRLDSDGSLSATLDSQDQGACVPCRTFTSRAGRPTVRGSWKGTIAADGNSLSGDWQQPGNSGPLNFIREVFVPAAKPSPVDGIWLGQVLVGKTPAEFKS